MNGPRELVAALLQASAALAAAVLDTSTWLHWHIVYPFSVTANSAMQQVVLLTEQELQHVVHMVFPVLEEVTMMTFSTVDAVTVVTVYSLYIWTDTVIQIVQQVVAAPSTELSIERSLSGGIAVCLVVGFALTTYAFVYHQYPTHKDWVRTVFSIVLPALYPWLWKSD